MDSEDKNINAAVRVSQVHNIDEEKLVFKVVVGIAKNNSQHGAYKFNLPPITDLCNSNEYNQAIIKIDQIVIDPFSALIAGAAQNNDRPVWTDRLSGPTAAAPFNNTNTSISSVIMMMRLPSRQTGHAGTNMNSAVNTRGVLYYRFMELIPTFWEWRGNYQGIQLTNNGPPPVANGNSYAIKHQPNNDGVLCANPFGSEIEFNFKNTADTEENQLNLYLADHGDAALPRDDITAITMQLSITLVPNKVRH
tara:strand:+ start:125 stop:874 length:750 start_codon:yes stop_codon:yes gene_type:complete